MTTTLRPTPGPTRAYRFPPFERRTMANGLRLLVAPVHKLPLVTTLLVTDAGAACDPIGREGIAQLTAHALLEGTTKSDGAAFVDRCERLGASIEAHADWDAAVAMMTVLAPQLPDAMLLFAETVLTPAFPEREVERLKAERLADLLQTRAEPRGLADQMFDRFTYADDSRYRLPDGGDEASVGAITRDAVGAFYADRYRPGGMTLIFAGDVTIEQAEDLAHRSFGALTGGTPAAAITLDRPARTSRAAQLVAKADAPQSELRIGHVGAPRNTPDFHALVVMNAVLGGLFSSRINLNLREVHGYTYGASSSFEWRRFAGPFVVSSAVRSDATADATAEVLREIDRIRQEPIRPEELSLATSYLDGIFPIRYETTAAIAGALANLVIHALPDDYFDTYRGSIRAVTEADVLRVAQAYLHPDALQVVVVGDAGTVRAPLERLPIGPLTVRDAETTAPA